MSKFPDITVGDLWTADLAASMLPDEIIKTTATIRASTTTLSDDPDLTVPVLANATYFIEMYIRYVSLSTPLFRTAWNSPAGATGNRAVLGPASTALDTNGDPVQMHSSAIPLSTGITYGDLDSTANQAWALETAIVVIGGTAGNVALQWAQSVSNASNTAVSAGSYIRSKRVA